MTEKAYFGLSSFWQESSFAKLKGVRITRTGYAGGTHNKPTFKNVHDHIEIIEVIYDPKLIGYEALLEHFWQHHNPTEKKKRQNQSAILYLDDAQKDSAMLSFEEAKKKYGDNIQTIIEPLNEFHLAENNNQKYWLRNNDLMIKNLKLSDEEIMNGELATKLNAFAAGYKDFGVLHELKSNYSLETDYIRKVEDFASQGGDPRAVC